MIRGYSGNFLKLEPVPWVSWLLVAIISSGVKFKFDQLDFTVIFVVKIGNKILHT